ncbi:type 4 pilus major pilin [Acidithiobacillus sp.]
MSMRNMRWVRRGISENRRERNEQGLSVMEIIIIVLVGLGLMVAVLLVFHRFQRDNEVSQGISDLSSSIASIQSQFNGQSSYGASGTSLNALAMDAKLVPSEMIVNGAIQNPWGGAVTIAAATQGFTIAYAGLSQSACNLLGKLQMGGLLSTTINGTVLPGGQNPPANNPVNVDGACTTGTANTITWNLD